MSKLSWDDIKETPPPSGGKREGGESPYVELKDGANYIRVVDDKTFYAVLMYYAYGRFQKSADEFGSSGNCPLANEVDEKGDNYRARPYFLFKVIDRSKDKLKVLRVGKQVLDMMKIQAKKPNWGPLTGYDLCITKRKKGENPLYLVAPEPKAPLSEEDEMLIKNDNINLEALSKPAKVEWVQKFIDEHKAGAQRSRSGNSKENTSSNVRSGSNNNAQKPRTPPAKAVEPEVSDDFQDVGETATGADLSDDEFNSI